MPNFGRFSSFAKFIESFEAEQQRTDRLRDEALSVEAQRGRRRRPRDIVEVSAIITTREPDDQDGDRHHRLLIRLTEIIESDPDVHDDLQANLEGKREVFVAIRFGDRMGILDPVPGLDPDVALRLRGEWIPRERAEAHGGERMSVLHFTHHPIGFVCTPAACFS